MDNIQIEREINAINALGVFNVIYTGNDDLIIVATNKTVSKVNYKALMKMNNNTYMKNIDFQTRGTIENFQILQDISLKTNRYSQETLKEKRSERANKKYGFKKSNTLSKEDKYLDEIDKYGYEL